jgi:hypothetical protein
MSGMRIVLSEHGGGRSKKEGIQEKLQSPGNSLSFLYHMLFSSLFFMEVIMTE